MNTTTFFYTDDYSELTALDTFASTITHEDLDSLIEISHFSDTASDSELRHMISDYAELLETTEYEWEEMERADVLDVLIEMGTYICENTSAQSAHSLGLLDEDQYTKDDCHEHLNVDWLADEC